MLIEDLERKAWADATAPGAILLVSDSAAASSELRVLLEQHGYEVTVERSIADALPALARVPPDLVMVDVELGEGDPWGFTASVRKEFPEVPLLAIAPRRMEVLERVRTACFAGVLAKPPGDEEALRLVSRLMFERLGPFRDLSAAPREAEEIEADTEFPGRLRVALLPMNRPLIESVRRDLSRRGIRYRELHEPWSVERDDVVFEFRLSVRRAFELGWHHLEVRYALVEAFPWLGTDIYAVDLRLWALRDHTAARKVS